MREVTRDQFCKMIGPLDVVSCIKGGYPYTHEFHMRSNRYDLIGKVVGYYPDGSALADNKYFIK